MGNTHLLRVTKPEMLENIVSTRNHKTLYEALKNIAFNYTSLYKYLISEFTIDSAQAGRSRSELLSELMEVSESTFYRWKTSKKRVDVKYAGRLSELMGLTVYGKEVLGSKTAFFNWLVASNIHLAGKAPIDILDNLPGIQYVKHLLDKIEYGAPV